MVNKWTSLLNSFGKQTEKTKKMNRIITKPIFAIIILFIIAFIILNITYKSLPKEEENKTENNKVLVKEIESYE